MNYFDHAASSPIYPEVLDILASSFRDDYANPSAQHLLGHNLSEKIEDFRHDFLKALKASRNDSIIFTSSATESNNTVIQGLDFSTDDIILYCKADHPSVTGPVESLVERFKINLKEIQLTVSGEIDHDLFLNQLNDKVKLVVLTHINNQNGVVNDIEALSKLVKEKSKAHLHIDATQSFGKFEITLKPHIDSMSFTSHKIGGPKGVAGLFLREGHKLRPLLIGGGQEHGQRSSTTPYPLIAGFHQAMKISMANQNISFEKADMLASMIKSKLAAAIPEIKFPFESTSPYITSFILPGISSDIIVRHLEMKNIFISTTSACSSKISGFNPSLFAMNIHERFHKNFLRISIGPATTETEVENLLREFTLIWNELKHLSKK